jgi:hypothetical protein
MQDASECLLALKAKPDQKDGWLSRKATALAQAVVDNLIFGVDNISITYREFTFVIGSMLFEPAKAESSQHALFSKIGKIAGLMIRCSALGQGFYEKPLLLLEDLDFTLIKGKAEDGYTMRLHSGIVRVQAEPIALKLGIRALSGLLLIFHTPICQNPLTFHPTASFSYRFRSIASEVRGRTWYPILDRISRKRVLRCFPRLFTRLFNMEASSFGVNCPRVSYFETSVSGSSQTESACSANFDCITAVWRL